MAVLTAKALLRASQGLQHDLAQLHRPPSETIAPQDQPVLPHSLFKGTRGYLQTVVFQINRSYATTCFDCCAVMIRRLVETLIIECFEHHGLGHKIKNADGDYLRLDDLTRLTLAESTWNLGRNTKKGLRRLKDIGDQSAHSRRYNARREYVDEVIVDLRVVAEELLYLAGLRK